MISGQQPLDLRGNLWAAYSDNPRTGEHRLDYFLRATDGKSYSLNEKDVGQVPAGSEVLLRARVPYGMSAANAILDVPQVQVVRQAAPIINGGVQKWAAVLCAFADKEHRDKCPFDAEFIRKLMSMQSPGMGDYWHRVSNTNLQLKTDVYDWVNVDQFHSAFWAPWNDDPKLRRYDVGSLGNYCIKKAMNAKKASSYDGFIFFYNFDLDGSAKGGTFIIDSGGKQRAVKGAWIPDWTQYGLHAATGHEIGHGESFGHSTDRYAKEKNRLGNPWDVMGDSWGFCWKNRHDVFGCLAQYPMAYWRTSNGWIKYAIAKHTEGVRVFRIAPAEIITEEPQALFIPIHDDVGYMFEVRCPMGDYDGKFLQELKCGAILTFIAPGNQYKVELIDMNGDGNDNVSDGSALLKPIHTMGDVNGITMCVLKLHEDSSMTIAVGKKKADCSKG